ncbi:MAG: hypothetical protein ACE5GQ_11505, partial [Nitrospinales bacterium]
MTEETYSKKFEEAAAQPKHRGAYYKEDALEKGMALVQAKFKDIKRRPVYFANRSGKQYYIGN